MGNDPPGKEIEDVIGPADDLLNHPEIGAAGALFPQPNKIVHLIPDQGLDPVYQIGHDHLRWDCGSIVYFPALLIIELDVHQVFIDVEVSVVAGTGHPPISPKAKKGRMGLFLATRGFSNR